MREDRSGRTGTSPTAGTSGRTGRPRGRRRRVLDAMLARALRIPAGRHGYRVAEDIPVPMRDGVELLTDVYLPIGSPQGTILIRTPYGRNSPVAVLTAGYYATHGYQVVHQSCRGTFGSGGEFRPFVAEVDDGADTVGWLREQPWFGGRFALCGASYLGFTAWAVMTDPPPELACAVISVSAHDNHGVTHPGGAFALEGTLTLLDGLDHIEDPFLTGLARFPTAARRLRPGYRELPLARAQQTVLAGSRMPYTEWLQAPDPDDPAWRSMRLGAALQRVRVPVLLHEGWQDRFVDQMLDQYAQLRRCGVDVALTVGPWSHVELATRAARVTMPETLDWLAEHLAGTGRRRRPAPVRVFVTGTGEWRDLDDWPPAGGVRTLHLQPGGRLAEDPPRRPASRRPSATTPRIRPRPSAAG